MECESRAYLCEFIRLKGIELELPIYWTFLAIVITRWSLGFTAMSVTIRLLFGFNSSPPFLPEWLHPLICWLLEP